MGKLLSVAQAVEYLGFKNANKLYYLVNANQIPEDALVRFSEKKKSSIYFKRAKLDEWLGHEEEDVY